MLKALLDSCRRHFQKLRITWKEWYTKLKFLELASLITQFQEKPNQTELKALVDKAPKHDAKCNFEIPLKMP